MWMFTVFKYGPFRGHMKRNQIIYIKIRHYFLFPLKYTQTYSQILFPFVFYSYPTRYIYSQFRQFFTKYSFTSMYIIPMIHNENEFLILRRQLIDQATVHEHKRAARIDIDSLVREKSVKRQQRAHSIIIYYIHENTFFTP